MIKFNWLAHACSLWHRECDIVTEPPHACNSQLYIHWYKNTHTDTDTIHFEQLPTNTFDVYDATTRDMANSNGKTMCRLIWHLDMYVGPLVGIYILKYNWQIDIASEHWAFIGNMICCEGSNCKTKYILNKKKKNKGFIFNLSNENTNIHLFEQRNDQKNSKNKNAELNRIFRQMLIILIHFKWKHFLFIFIHDCWWLVALLRFYLNLYKITL